MKFTKMQGLGNDYIYVYGEVPQNISELCVKLSDRHFGIGSDGMIFISPSKKADYKMRIFNADGSEAKMCGNGIRCVGKFLFDKGYVSRKNIKIETLSGIKNIEIEKDCKTSSEVKVDMGKSAVGEKKSLSIAGKIYDYIPVDMGNPHAVIFENEDISDSKIIQIGMEFQKITEGGINVEFVSVASENKLKMRVYERGSGITMACGTGACASVAAAVKRGLVLSGQEVEVLLDGGELNITVQTDGQVRMRGPAVTVYEGEYYI